MASDPLVVHDAASLQPLLAGRRRRVTVTAPSLAPSERERWEARLNDHARACGCDTGGWAMLAAVALYAAAVLSGTGPLPRGWIVRVLLGVLFVFLASIAGKLLGLFRARRRFAADARRLHHALLGAA